MGSVGRQGLCLLAVGLLTAGAWALPDQAVLRVDANLNGDVYVRPSDTEAEWKLASTNNSHCNLEIPANQMVDVEVRGARTRLFWVYRGRYIHARAPGSAPIYMRAELDYAAVAAAVGGVALVGLAVTWGLRRRALHHAQQAQAALTATERQLRTLQAHGSDPTQLEGYRVVGRLGEGGMARVYEVEDEYGDHYALKIPNGDLRRFQQEFEILHSFQHPGIVRVKDFQPKTDEHPAFLVMELIDGETLGQRLRARGRLPVDTAKDIARNILQVLKYTHARGIIHRDITPNNVFLTYGGGVKLVDFGISKNFQSDLTVTGEMLGTPAYAAPEQIESQSATERTDLYQVGVLLFEMTTGRQPFATGDPLKLFMEKSQGPAQSPHQLNSRIDPALSDLIMRLLSPDPTHRPATADDVLEALQ